MPLPLFVYYNQATQPGRHEYCNACGNEATKAICIRDTALGESVDDVYLCLNCIPKLIETLVNVGISERKGA